MAAGGCQPRALALAGRAQVRLQLVGASALLGVDLTDLAERFVKRPAKLGAIRPRLRDPGDDDLPRLVARAPVRDVEITGSRRNVTAWSAKKPSSRTAKTPLRYGLCYRRKMPA
jgi:hypothetical protein